MAVAKTYREALPTFIRYIRGDEQLLNAAQSGNIDAVKQMLVASGMDNPTDAEAQSAMKLASAFDTRKYRHDQEVNERRNETRRNNAKTKRYMDNVTDIMKMDPKTRAIYAAVKAGSSLIRGIGDHAEYRANKLASALLEQNRRQNPGQDNIYGPSRMLASANVIAGGEQAAGRLKNHVLNSIADGIDDFAGSKAAEDAGIRSRKLAALDNDLNNSGAFWGEVGRRDRFERKN